MSDSPRTSAQFIEDQKRFEKLESDPNVTAGHSPTAAVTEN
jgi:hypothetical protein